MKITNHSKLGAKAVPNKFKINDIAIIEPKSIVNEKIKKSTARKEIDVLGIFFSFGETFLALLFTKQILV